MNAGGSIDFSDHFQLVRTLDCPIQNAAYERFIRNPIVNSQFSIELNTPENAEIIIDGIPHFELDSSEIKRVDISIDGSNYIHKLELGTYSKVQTVRQKILGYDD